MNDNNNNLEIEKNSFNYINPQLTNSKQNLNDNVDLPNEKGIGINIIHPNKPGVDGYKVFIRQDGFPDFGNFIYFDDKVEFDPKKYKRPEIYFGFIHDQYVVPQILGLKNNNKKEKKEEEVKQQNKEEKKIDNEKLKPKKINKKKVVKNLDDIMTKLNLKYIEPPKIEKIVEPPPEEENVEEEENPKDKNKKGKDTNSAKGKNVKDDKNKAANTKTNKK